MLEDSKSVVSSSSPEGVFLREILIVDDDVTYLKLIKSWISAHYRVTSLKSGQQALKYLEGHHPDLVLLDYEMPDVNGEEVLRCIRSKSETEFLPVFILTGNAHGEYAGKIMALSPQGYLAKTLGKIEILAAIDNYFAKKDNNSNG